MYYELIIPASSFVNKVKYNPARGHLQVSIANRTYRYLDVPQWEVDNLENAVSVGQYFNSTIKTRYVCESLTAK